MISTKQKYSKQINHIQTIKEYGNVDIKPCRPPVSFTWTPLSTNLAKSNTVSFLPDCLIKSPYIRTIIIIKCDLVCICMCVCVRERDGERESIYHNDWVSGAWRVVSTMAINKKSALDSLLFPFPLNAE